MFLLLLYYVKQLEILSEDIIYNIRLKNTNKDIERKEKDQIKFKISEYIEYFLDITFKIIPKYQWPYKLMTFSALDNKQNKAILVCFNYLYGFNIIIKHI